MEPQNAFYNFMKAAALIGQGCRLVEDPGSKFILRHIGELNKEHTCHRTEIVEPNLFAEGLREFRNGLVKPYYTNHGIDMARLRISLLPPASGCDDLCQRMSLADSVQSPGLSDLRFLARALSGHVLALGKTGRGTEAQRLIGEIRILATKPATRANTVVEAELLSGMRRCGLGVAINAYRKLGLIPQAEHAKAELDEENRIYGEIRRWNADPALLAHGGLFLSAFGISLPGFHLSAAAPYRQMEYLFVDRIALAMLLFLYIYGLLLLVLETFFNLVRFRNSPEGPKFLWIGFGPMLKIIVLGGILPIGLYGLYTWLPFGGRDFGINVTAARLLLEYATVGTVVISLLLGLTRSAIRQRAEEAGIVPAPAASEYRRTLPIVLGTILAVAVVLSIAGWEMGYEPARENIHFFVLTFLVVMFLLVFGLDGNACSFKTRKQYVNYFRTCSRSAIPILATAVIVIGSVTGIILDRGEKRASREAVVFNLNEFDLCDMGRLRDRYADQHSTFLGEYVRNFTR